MYVLIVYFANNIEFTYCDTYEEAEEELEKINKNNSVERYEIMYR